jgi:hypothetical protein
VTDQLVSGITKHRFGVPVHENDPALGIRDKDGYRKCLRGLNELFQARLHKLGVCGLVRDRNRGLGDILFAEATFP